ERGRREQVGMRLGERAEEGAPDLLLAVEDELEVDPGWELELVHEGERFEMRPDRTLVVRGAAREDTPAGEVFRGQPFEGDMRGVVGVAHAPDDRLGGRWQEPPPRRRGVRVEGA